MADFKIRAVTADDRHRWQELMHAYAEFYQTSVDAGGLENTWSWITDPDNDFWCSMVEQDGQIVGFTQ